MPKYLIIGHRPAGGSPSELGNNTDMQAAIAKAKEFAGYLEAYAKITVEADGPGGGRKTWFSVGCQAATGVPGPKPQPVRSSVPPHVNPYTRDQLPPALREQPKMSESNGSKAEPAPKPPVDLSNPAVQHPMPDEQIRTNRLAEIKAANDRLAASKQQSRSGPTVQDLDALVKSMPTARTPELEAAAKEKGWTVSRDQLRAARERLDLPPLKRGRSPGEAYKPAADHPWKDGNKPAVEAAAPVQAPTPAPKEPEQPKLKRPLTGMAKPGPKPKAVQPERMTSDELERLIAFGQALKPWGGREGARRLLDKIDQFMEAIA